MATNMQILPSNTPSPGVPNSPGAFAAMQPDNGPQAVGTNPLDQASQDVINSQLSKGATPASATADLSNGLNNSFGLMKGSNANSLGGTTPDDFQQTLQQQGANAVANSANQIQQGINLNAPVTQARFQQQAAENLAKTSQLSYNNWVLRNKQALSALQIQQAQNAAQASFLNSLLSLGGAAVGAVGGAIVGGPGGALAGANIGSKL